MALRAGIDVGLPETCGYGERPVEHVRGGAGGSDGSSTLIPTCGGNARNGFNMSGALPNAPLSGHWFSAQFQKLMRNAYPAL
ncbi:hypothetical protein LZG04_15260 [Saccharothrix sp. S26]|uniref:hypothetical protein n=1 Tax=Saccharothrix sp. S26 TaxID=2907215 RepID=UPI001F25D1E1|nr:hypothetical protein [Saccharothrix sp. S26]MCE6996151.1 hypothetical protein [Saccharothrix sp. S26]